MLNGMLTSKNDWGLDRVLAMPQREHGEVQVCSAGLTSGPAAAGARCTAGALAHPQPPLLPVLPVQQPFQLLLHLQLLMPLLLVLPFQGCPS